MKKLIKTIILIISILALSTTLAYAHSGKTDSNGGHKDKNNVSGLGSYHYHCGGYPAHLHTNGVCPYSSSQSTEKKQSKPTAQTTPSQSNTQTSSTKSQQTNPPSVPESLQPKSEEKTSLTEPNTPLTPEKSKTESTTTPQIQETTEPTITESTTKEPSQTSTDSNDSSIAGLAYLGIAGGGAYYGYKKSSKKKLRNKKTNVK